MNYRKKVVKIKNKNAVRQVISIVMPAFNSEETIKETIDSILSQTYPNFELIIIDDSSTDDTVKIIKSYNDKRIRIIQNKKNIGITASLNRGIDASSGKYFARMDADDIMLVDRLEKQLCFMESHDYDIITGRGIKINSEGKEIGFVGESMSNNEIQVSLLFGCCLFHPTLFGKMKIFKENRYDPRFRRAGDHELWIRLKDMVKFFTTNDLLIKYRVGKDENEINKRRIAEEFVEELKTRNKAELKTLSYSKLFEKYGVSGLLKYLQIILVKKIKNEN